jgi:hypothetical protein
VGGRQALDHFPPTLTVLEVEELLVVDRRLHVERAQRLLARGWVQDDENARYPWPKSSSAHWSNFAPKWTATRGCQ